MESSGMLRCRTDRERRLLLWVADRKTNAEIGLIVKARTCMVLLHSMCSAGRDAGDRSQRPRTDS
jgi:hypothetical protein